MLKGKKAENVEIIDYNASGDNEYITLTVRVYRNNASGAITVNDVKQKGFWGAVGRQSSLYKQLNELFDYFKGRA